MVAIITIIILITIPTIFIITGEINSIIKMQLPPVL